LKIGAPDIGFLARRYLAEQGPFEFVPASTARWLQQGKDHNMSNPATPVQSCAAAITE
jgi:hypothetical protein